VPPFSRPPPRIIGTIIPLASLKQNWHHCTTKSSRQHVADVGGRRRRAQASSCPGCSWLPTRVIVGVSACRLGPPPRLLVSLHRPSSRPGLLCRPLPLIRLQSALSARYPSPFPSRAADVFKPESWREQNSCPLLTFSAKPSSSSRLDSFRSSGTPREAAGSRTKITVELSISVAMVGLLGGCSY
jgi:hypothetical protein